MKIPSKMGNHNGIAKILIFYYFFFVSAIIFCCGFLSFLNTIFSFSLSIHCTKWCITWHHCTHQIIFGLDHQNPSYCSIVSKVILIDVVLSFIYSLFSACEFVGLLLAWLPFKSVCYALVTLYLVDECICMDVDFSLIFEFETML